MDKIKLSWIRRRREKENKRDAFKPLENSSVEAAVGGTQWNINSIKVPINCGGDSTETMSKKGVFSYHYRWNLLLLKWGNEITNNEKLHHECVIRLR